MRGRKRRAAGAERRGVFGGCCIHSDTSDDAEEGQAKRWAEMTNVLITWGQYLAHKLMGWKSCAPHPHSTATYTFHQQPPLHPLHSSLQASPRLSTPSSMWAEKCVCVCDIWNYLFCSNSSKKEWQRERVLEVKEEADSSVMFQQTERHHLELTCYESGTERTDRHEPDRYLFKDRAY